MYRISDTQIDYILNDISARGVEMESLQQNLLDHVCCIIEQNLEANGDFESFYKKTIKTFYKDALWEIEEETIQLLTFKNYYTMKKIMISSGMFAAAAMSFGILFKFMHWPGASVCIVLGIITSSLVFLPLLFTLKAKEQQSNKDKFIIGLGTLAGMLMSLSILFKVMHWPYAINLGVISLIILGLLFLPIYFFTGIRQPDKKVNTIAVSILIIMVCGLWLTLIRSPRSTRLIDIRDTYSFVRAEQIVKTEREQTENYLKNDTNNRPSISLSRKIDGLCEELKSFMIEHETGHKTIGQDFENKKIFLEDDSGISPLLDNAASLEKMTELIKMVDVYNAGLPSAANNIDIKQIPTKASFIDYFKSHDLGLVTRLGLLNQLTQIQLFVLQNERELIMAHQKLAEKTPGLKE